MPAAANAAVTASANLVGDIITTSTSRMSNSITNNPGPCNEERESISTGHISEPSIPSYFSSLMPSVLARARIAENARRRQLRLAQRDEVETKENEVQNITTDIADSNFNNGINESRSISEPDVSNSRTDPEAPNDERTHIDSQQSIERIGITQTLSVPPVRKDYRLRGDRIIYNVQSYLNSEISAPILPQIFETRTVLENYGRTISEIDKLRKNQTKPPIPLYNHGQGCIPESSFQMELVNDLDCDGYTIHSDADILYEILSTEVQISSWSSSRTPRLVDDSCTLLSQNGTSRIYFKSTFKVAFVKRLSQHFGIDLPTHEEEKFLLKQSRMISKRTFIKFLEEIGAPKIWYNCYNMKDNLETYIDLFEHFQKQYGAKIWLDVGGMFLPKERHQPPWCNIPYITVVGCHNSVDDKGLGGLFHENNVTFPWVQLSEEDPAFIKKCSMQEAFLDLCGTVWYKKGSANSRRSGYPWCDQIKVYGKHTHHLKSEMNPNWHWLPTLKKHLRKYQTNFLRAIQVLNEKGHTFRDTFGQIRIEATLEYVNAGVTKKRYSILVHDIMSHLYGKMIPLDKILVMANRMLDYATKEKKLFQGNDKTKCEFVDRCMYTWLCSSIGITNSYLNPILKQSWQSCGANMLLHCWYNVPLENNSSFQFTEPDATPEEADVIRKIKISFVVSRNKFRATYRTGNGGAAAWGDTPKQVASKLLERQNANESFVIFDECVLQKEQDVVATVTNTNTEGEETFDEGTLERTIFDKVVIRKKERGWKYHAETITGRSFVSGSTISDVVKQIVACVKKTNFEWQAILNTVVDEAEVVELRCDRFRDELKVLLLEKVRIQELKNGKFRATTKKGYVFVAGSSKEEVVTKLVNQVCERNLDWEKILCLNAT